MRVFVKGLNSCGMRKTDVKRYRDYLAAQGHELVTHPDHADKILLWTCAFRRDMRDNSMAEIARYRREYAAELIVCGCLPDIDAEVLQSHFDGAVIPWRDEDRLLPVHFGPDPGRPVSQTPRLLGEPRLCEDVARFKRENPAKDASFVDQFHKLFATCGCRFECTYCSERLAFPPYRSFPQEDLVARCRQLVSESGAFDVMLLGDSIGDWGSDIGQTLPDLMHALLAIDPRLRLSLQGLNPAHFVEFFDAFSAMIEAGRIRHFQLPIQSASPRILKAMKRPYTRPEIDRVFGYLNRVGFGAFDTHLIVGFPGEEEADFEESLAFVLRHRPSYVLASGFMASPGMAASHLPHPVDDATRKRRLQQVAARVRATGMLCNTDDSDLSAQRCRTINLIDN